MVEVKNNFKKFLLNCKKNYCCPIKPYFTSITV